MKKVLITGCAGQDGYLLSKALSEKGYDVYGMDLDMRPNRAEYVKMVDADVSSFRDVLDVVKDVMPDEVYHLAAITRPGVGLVAPFDMMKVNVGGTLNVLEAVRSKCPETRVLYVSSDSVFADEGRYYQPPYDWIGEQNEHTPMSPSDLYGVTKATGLMLARVYRSYGISVGCVIPFNHACAFQGDGFLLGYVAREVVRVCGEIKDGKKPKPIEMKSRYDVRDFLHAQDVVDAMVLVMEKGGNADYVVGSGRPRTVEEIVGTAYWLAVKRETGWGCAAGFPSVHTLVKYKFDYCDGMKPNADARRLRGLGWEPKISFELLVVEMIETAKKNAK